MYYVKSYEVTYKLPLENVYKPQEKDTLLDEKPRDGTFEISEPETPVGPGRIVESLLKPEVDSIEQDVPPEFRKSLS